MSSFLFKLNMDEFHKTTKQSSKQRQQNLAWHKAWLSCMAVLSKKNIFNFIIWIMINVYIFLEKYFLGKESDLTIRIPFQPKGLGFYHFIKKKNS